MLIGQKEQMMVVNVRALRGVVRRRLRFRRRKSAAFYPLTEEELVGIVVNTGLRRFTPTNLVDFTYPACKNLEQAREQGQLTPSTRKNMLSG